MGAELNFDAESTPELIEARIVSMYDKTLADYRAYLEDDQPPYDLQDDLGWDIRGFGHELFFATAAKLAQKKGIGVRVNFPLDEYPSWAQLSYASTSERDRERNFLDNDWGNLRNTAVNNLLIDFSDSTIIAAAALRAEVPVKELLFGYMHLTEGEITAIEGRYDFARETCSNDLDLYYRLVLQRNMDSYVDRGLLELMDGFQKLTESSKQLGMATGKISLEDFTKYDKDMTENISKRNYMHMRYRIVEDLVNAGYTPLEPEEYERCVRQVFPD